MIGSVIPQFNNKNWVPGVLISSFLFTFSWGYLVYTGNVSSIWPLFGISNQLLAVLAMLLMLIIFIAAFRKWYELLSIRAEKPDKHGELVKELVD